MAVTQHASGSQSATVTTEHFLGTDPDTTAGAFQFFVNTANMVRGDELEVRVYEKINDSGDTAQCIHVWTVKHDQQENMWKSPVLCLLVGWRFSIKQTVGAAGRTFQWSVRKASATITQHASGDQAASINTEHFLGTDPDTTAGAYQFMVDLSVLQRGDTIEIRVYEKINDSGDTAEEITDWCAISHEQSCPLFVSPSFLLLIGWRFSIKQTAGTGRTFPWSIRKAA